MSVWARDSEWKIVGMIQVVGRSVFRMDKKPYIFFLIRLVYFNRGFSFSMIFVRNWKDPGRFGLTRNIYRHEREIDKFWTSLDGGRNKEKKKTTKKRISTDQKKIIWSSINWQARYFD